MNTLYNKTIIQLHTTITANKPSVGLFTPTANLRIFSDGKDETDEQYNIQLKDGTIGKLTSEIWNDEDGILWERKEDTFYVDSQNDVLTLNIVSTFWLPVQAKIKNNEPYTQNQDDTFNKNEIYLEFHHGDEEETVIETARKYNPQTPNPPANISLANTQGNLATTEALKTLLQSDSVDIGYHIKTTTLS